MVQDAEIVTVKCYVELVCALSNGTISGDFEWP